MGLPLWVSIRSNLWLSLSQHIRKRHPSPMRGVPAKHVSRPFDYAAGYRRCVTSADTHQVSGYSSSTRAGAVLDKIQHSYNDRWSCPLTPFEDRLKVAIRAGEKLYAPEGEGSH